ncbi:MAG: 30S ribosomal protein S5 [Candidatus Spechtbacteria bacterium]|nr:30S ribosomal protein S5 [Candidatus Spechtbacteria bacterium]
MGPGGGRGGERRGGIQQRRERGPQTQREGSRFASQEFEQKLLQLARVARVTKGGRRFSFRATVVIGDRNGRVGVGVAKGTDVSAAVEKAVRNAKRALIIVPMTKNKTVPYEVIGKQTSARVFLAPAFGGRGIIAGGAVRAVCDLAGYRDISAKILGRTSNKLNNALATIKALQSIKMMKRGKVTQNEVISNETVVSEDEVQLVK